MEVNNRILRALSKEAFADLSPWLEEVSLQRRAVLDGVDEPLRDLYFVNQGLVPLVKTMHDGRTVEIGAVGIEGLADPFGIFDANKALLESVVQVPGTAFRIKRTFFRAKMRENAEILDLMHRYVTVAMNQFAQTAACNGLHSLEERCCRWLLIAHDSALADEFLLTHEFLAMMLGVARASVSLTAKILQRAGLIRYAHGTVTITDRAGLEATACECYGTIRAQLDGVFSAA